MHHNFIDRTGEIHKIKEGYTAEIIKYRGSGDCDIRLEGGTVLENVRYSHIKSGIVRNPFHPSVYGVGYIEKGDYKSSENGKSSVIYGRWHGILQRCYEEDYYKKKPSYKNCTVTEEWYNFQNFAKWFEENYVEGWHIDKDILVKCNKIYGPDTCCFVPYEINNWFRGYRRNQKLPKGVYHNGIKYQAEIKFEGNTKHIGLYKSVEQAFQAYKKEKEKYIKELADKYKNQLRPKVYQALYNYKAEITD